MKTLPPSPLRRGLRAASLALGLLVVSFASPATAQTSIKHRFLAVDNGANRLLLVDQIGNRGWSISIPSGSRDLQLLPGGKVLVSHGNGAAEYDVATGAKGWSVTGYASITTASRLENGNTLLGGNVDGVTLYEIGADKSLKSKFIPKGVADLRLARRLKNGNTLLGLAGSHRVVEVDAKGVTVWSAGLTDKAYVAYRLDDGRTLATSGEDAYVYSIAPDGKATVLAGGLDNHPKAGLLWFSGFEILPNGNFLVANWNGHGKEGQGPHAVEFNARNELVWSWTDHQAASTVTNVLSVEGAGPSGVGPHPQTPKAWRRVLGRFDLLGRLL
jgi:hypothetical protein